MFRDSEPVADTLSSATETFLQRLFSMFPNGRPGAGLLLLRLVAGLLLIQEGTAGLLRAPPMDVVAEAILAIAAGILLLAGLWTPIAGLLVVALQSWIAFSQPAHLRYSLVLATIGAALAMLGPGARSIDARLFGRKRIDIRGR